MKSHFKDQAMFEKNIIHKSYDYDKFKFVKYNRNICQKNLAKLIKLNEERGRFHLFPIVVDKELNIIDGQHRYEASKQLSVPIHYVIDTEDESHWEQITKVNIAGKKHDVNDIFAMLLKDGDPACIELQEIIDDFPYMPLGDLCRFFMGTGDRRISKTCLDLMREKEHKIINKQVKLSCLSAFFTTFNYFKLGHVQNFKNLWEATNTASPYELAQSLQTKGFIPIKSWSIPTFKADMVRHYNKGRQSKNKVNL